MFYYTIKISEKWIYSGDGINSIKTRKFFSKLKNALEEVATFTSEGIGTCDIESELQESIINKKIMELADEYLPEISKDRELFSISTYDDSDPEEYDDEKIEEFLFKEFNRKPEIETINELVGLEDFKKYCNEVAESSKEILNRKSLFFSEALLVVCDEGNGFEENLDSFIRFLSDYNLILFGPAERYSFGSYFDKPEEFPNLKIKKSLPSVYVFDINGWIGYTNDSRFKSVLKFIFNTNKDNLIIFLMGNRSKTVIEDTVKEIEDIINVRLIEFPDFTDDQLYSYAEKEFEKLGFKPDENTAEVFKDICDYEKEDGLFYGLNTVTKIVGEMARESFKAGSTDLINSQACRSIIPEKPDSKYSLKAIEEMVGMEDVARQMREIIAQVMFSRANGAKSPAMHMLFVGNPGTGKTTVARVLGQIFRENQILRAGKFYEHKGRDLCGEYIGQTAVKVNNICRNAYGSVLFIDEAYSLATDRKERDYGKEAIDTLIAEMENHRDDLVVIFAGYPDEMEHLLNSNPGMRSRIPYRITFPNFSKEQLHQIYMQMVEKNNFPVAEDFSKHVEKYFMDIPEEMLNSKQFGNARFVRNVFERTWGKAILRSPAGTYEVPPLAPEDFDAAASEITPENIKEKKLIGF